MLPPRIGTLLLYIALASAARLQITIPPSPQLPDPNSLPSTSHAILLGPPGIRYDVPLRRDNTFTFSDLEPASYLLTIHSRDYFFPPLRVDVVASNIQYENTQSPVSSQTISAWQTFRGNEWSNKGPHYGSAQNDLEIIVGPIGRKDFYQERGGFSLIGFLKSPMILMGLVSVVMIFGFPYLMDNMDPETKKEFDDLQKKGGIMGADNPASQIQNFDLAGWMAGKK